MKDYSKFYSTLADEDKFKNSAKLLRFDSDSEETVGNIKAVLDPVHEIAKNSFDCTWPYQDICISTEPSLCWRNAPKFLLQAYGHGFEFSQPGFVGLCQQLNTPMSYIRKLAQEDGGFALACNNLNFWIQHKKEGASAFIRTTNDIVYGVLSDRYSVYDDLDVLSDFAEIFTSDRFVIKNASVSPTMMKIRFVSRDKFTLANGDEMSYGFDLTNSRTGQSSLRVQFLVFRWACSNGMIFGGASSSYFLQRHIKISRDEFVSSFVEFMEKIPELSKFCIEQIQKSAATKITPDLLDSLLDKFRIMTQNQAAADKMKMQIETNVVTVTYAWDFLNLITQMAQEQEIAMREKMEVAAGSLCTFLYKKG